MQSKYKPRDPQGKLIEESKKMVKDTHTRLGKAAIELRDLVVRVGNSE